MTPDEQGPGPHVTAADPLAGQRRGRRIAMTREELDEFLALERICRVATIGAGGVHNTPLWFVWHEGVLWLHSIVKSQRWVDMQRDPRVSAVVDTGHDFVELRGVELVGEVTVAGEVPRTGEPAEELAVPERLYARKYAGSDQMVYDGRHAWLRLTPEKVASWDFRKQFGPAKVAASPNRVWADRYVETINAGRYDELGALFAPDAAFLPPNGTTLIGPDEITRFYSEFLPTIRPQVRISSFFEAGPEAMFALSATLVDRPDEVLGAVDHVTVGTDGRARRLVIFPRSQP